jgi:two-component system response regulator FlrC
MTQLKSSAWKGNIRELENAIERSVLIGNGPKLIPQDLILDSVASEDQFQPAFPMKAGVTVREMEKQLISKTLEEVSDNRTRAAELLGISIRTLRNKLREYQEELESSQAKTARQSG